MSGPTDTRPGGGARRALRAPRRPDRTGILAAVLVALATVLVLLAPAGDDDSAAARPDSVPVRQLLVGCPGAAPDVAEEPEMRIGLAPSGRDAASGLTVRATTPVGEAVHELVPGRLSEVPVPEDGAVALAADGSPSGLVAVQADGSAGTLAGTACLPPAAQWWFTGAGGTLQHTSVLVLDNLDPGPATVDVEVLGPAGPIESLSGRGVSVPPGERVVLPVPELAPQADELTVHVRATRGRVVATAADRLARRIGADPGSDWLPAQPGPRLVHRLAGIDAATGGHTLLLSNPGDREALVDLQVSTPSGTFTPTGETQLRVAPGTVVVEDVSEVLPPDAGALVVRSSVPLLSSVRIATRSDTASVAAPERLRAPAAVTIPQGARAVVTLAAGDAGARAVVASYDGTGEELESTTVDLGPGAAHRTEPVRRAAYVVVVPVRGDLRGATTWIDGTGVAVLPLTELPRRVRRPVVEPAY